MAMTMTEKNEKIARELREMCTALGYSGASAMLTEMRRAYMAGAPVLIMVAGSSRAAIKDRTQPPDPLRGEKPGAG